jgi:hypothetical protein
VILGTPGAGKGLDDIGMRDVLHTLGSHDDVDDEESDDDNEDDEDDDKYNNYDDSSKSINFILFFFIADAVNAIL